MIITIIWLIVAILALAQYLYQIYSTFSKSDLNHLPVIPFFGHFFGVFFKLEHVSDEVMRSVNAFPDDKIIGFYELVTPIYVLKDAELIKKVNVKDFDYFVDRRSFATEFDPMFGKNLFHLKGDDWREMRACLSPAFTSSRIRLMVPFIVEVGEQMINVIRGKIEDSGKGFVDLELKDFTSRYANDVIASCAFGLKVDSQSSDNNFYLKAKDITKFNFTRMLRVYFYRSFPSIANMLNLKLSSPETSRYFKDLVVTTMENRKKNNIVRQDMIYLLNEIRKGKLSHSKAADLDAGYATVEESPIGKKTYKKDWTDDELVAQAVIFLFTGFDTVSRALLFILYEIAGNPEVQDKLVKEIQEHDVKNDGKIDFNSIQSMKYLDMVVSEGLRMYPFPSFLDRQCVKSYNLGRANKTSKKDVIVHKGDIVGYPVWAIHHDPEIYPDPLKFKPERFSKENIHNIKPLTYLPFGLGPRNCIGSRFALCEVKVMLYQLLREMKISLCERTVYPAKLIKGLALNVQGGAWVRLRVRQ